MGPGRAAVSRTRNWRAAQSLDAAAWRAVDPNQYAGQGPHVGYVGTLQDDRLDIDLVLRFTNCINDDLNMPRALAVVWDRTGAIHRYEVVVQRDLARLSDQLRDLFPGETITAQSNGKSVVLSGKASTKDIIEKAVSVAAGYVDKKEDVVSLLQVQDTGTPQVLLRVRFAEVSRSAMQELGASLILNQFKAGFYFGVQGGYGIVMVKKPSGRWSVPVLLRAAEASLGQHPKVRRGRHHEAGAADPREGLESHVPLLPFTLTHLSTSRAITSFWICDVPS